jgi:type II secretory ATPase GspE/PulE/Tfp pilus assembly ATPase PilB-like protein
MILTCGPTGSGKTTTLYACLNALNSIERNIVTIEDPVEYQVAGIIQGNVNTKAGVNFATGLRTLVRQDPDIILVGEIRDEETARIAVEAALTGHLVLSTIHANDSAGAVTRLIDMGVEPFLVSSALVAAVSQRLVRIVCPRCVAPYSPDPFMIESLGCADLLAPSAHFQFKRGLGCESCNRSGYKGRTGVYELMEVTAEIQRMILAQAPTQDIKAAALARSRTLRDDAVLKIRQGVTTAEEVLRVTI